MKILNKNQIVEIVKSISTDKLISCIEDAFIAYSDGSAQVPPVGYLGFIDPPGDVHIKYGHIKNDPYYVIKIASGFFKNAESGLPTGSGMMLVFDAKTGMPVCQLLDEGYLTDLRTALAGAVAAKHLAPKEINAIGIIGTGVQARFQLEMLRHVTDCKSVFVWGRSQAKANLFLKEMNQLGFNVKSSKSPFDVAANCNLIVTTTPSDKPILQREHIKPGTHITAMGSDAPGKQELDTGILSVARHIVCDSKSQCVHHGETHFAVKDSLIKENALYEMGYIINHPQIRNATDITIADLTGIATQDIKIASLVISND